jgi:hypothetical protein
VAASLKQQFKNYISTFRSSTPTAIVANGFNIGSRAYQWVFAALLGLKPDVAQSGSYAVCFFFASVFYSTLHGFIMPLTSTLSTRWSAHENQTASYLANSIEQIRHSLGQSIPFDALHRERFIHGILTTINSHVERWIVESAGMYINVSLLIEDPEDPSRLAVIARAHPNRQNVSYPKTSLFAWGKCWKPKTVYYAAEFSDNSKPYKCILLVPLKIQAANGNKSVVGVISIDSSKTHHFDGLEFEIESKLLPELSLLKLAIE